MGSAFAWRRATAERETRWRKRGVPLVRLVVSCDAFAACVWRTVWRNCVRDVAPCGFARPWAMIGVA